MGPFNQACELIPQGGERAPQADGGRPCAGEAGAAGRRLGKLLSPERRRCAMAHTRGQYGLYEWHLCRLLAQWRGSQRYTPIQRSDEDPLTRAIVTLVPIGALRLPTDHGAVAERRPEGR
jgi:hypothetical protein